MEYRLIKSIIRLWTKPALQAGLMVLAAILFSCGQKGKVPEGILTPDQMVSALSELYIAEQKISTLGIPRDSLRQIFDVMEGKIFAKVNSSDTVFKKSLNYYVDRPKTLELIYTALVDSLSLREQRLISGELEQ